jgi:hypothetical protein
MKISESVFEAACDAARPHFPNGGLELCIKEALQVAWRLQGALDQETVEKWRVEETRYCQLLQAKINTLQTLCNGLTEIIGKAQMIDDPKRFMIDELVKVLDGIGHGPSEGK